MQKYMGRSPQRELPKTGEVEDQLLYGLKICRIRFAGLLAGFKLVFLVRTQQACFDLNVHKIIFFLCISTWLFFEKVHSYESKINYTQLIK